MCKSAQEVSDGVTGNFSKYFFTKVDIIDLGTPVLRIKYNPFFSLPKNVPKTVSFLHNHPLDHRN
jgi:hypothetical protein